MCYKSTLKRRHLEKKKHDNYRLRLTAHEHLEQKKNKDFRFFVSKREIEMETDLQ